MTECIFCSLDPSKILIQANKFYVIKDSYPVTSGHLLILPKAHRETFFDLTFQEQHEVNKLLRRLKEDLMTADPTIKGFNIGMNCGKAAGQTVMHCHVHLIPRRIGDMEDPNGGVRGVIPSKQKC